jgi:phage terminase large subunit-like protein
VRAVKSKRDRALPVSTMYRQGLVTHAEVFPRLVAQMTGWDPDTSEESPDRLDALVWGLTWLAPTVKSAAKGAPKAPRPDYVSQLPPRML